MTIKYFAIVLSFLTIIYRAEAADINFADVQKAVSAENITELSKMIENGFDVNSRDDDGNTILYYALLNSADLKVIRILTEAGADVNAPSALNGMTPLIVATSKASDIQKQMSLLYAQGQSLNNEEKLKEFIAEQLKYALAIVKFLTEQGADINQETPLGTPLMNAVSNAWNYDIVEYLLQAGADVNQRDRYGRTALFYASANNCNKIVTKLLAAGADINILDYNKKSYMEITTEDLKN